MCPHLDLLFILLTTYKISVAEIARLYGEDMTYHAVENYLRRFRKEAKDMRGQAEGRESTAPSPARPRVKKAADEDNSVKAGSVEAGRITKKKKKISAAKVKTEVIEQEIGGLGSEDAEEVPEEI
jgi:hypothetical protein